MKPVLLLRQAEIELAEAHAFYHGCSPQVGKRFMREFERIQSLAGRFPEMYPKGMGNARSCVFQRFPYTLFYRVHAEHIQVVAIVHQSREPGYWSHRS